MSALRVGVVGAGEMGRLHARTVAAAARRGTPCELVGIADHHPGRAAVVAGECGTTGFEDLAPLVEDVDAMIVAVPTTAHFALASTLLGRGLDLLVEKPLAESVIQGERLVEQSRREGRILQVGHVEWYNPAWREAARRAGTIRKIEVERLNPPTPRGQDIDVVQDLMLHDLDWVSRLVGDEIVEIEACGRRGRAGRLDEVEARLRFRSGCSARLRASRVHRERRRVARIEGREAVATADLSARSVITEEGDPTGATRPATPDPLSTQWLDFVEAVASREPPLNSGEIGLAALRLVDRVQSAIGASAGVGAAGRIVTTILVSAGDASGEAHAAGLVRAMRELRPDARFVGMGGPQMAAAGVEIVVDQAELAVGGFFEILPSLGRLWRAWRRMLECVRSERPEAIVLVDSGGFHLPFARRARRIVAAPILYYVAPQIWAWRPRRLKKIAARADRIVVILPFERDFYAARGVEVDFVGHPLLDRIRPAISEPPSQSAAREDASPGRSVDVQPDRAGARARLSVGPDESLLALFPGSRRNELERNLPIQLAAFERLREERPGLRGLVGLAASLDLRAAEAIVARGPSGIREALEIVPGGSGALGLAADVALAKPGTITVELMLNGCPMVVIGRVHPWTAWIARFWVDLPWLAMPNLIAGEAIVPELMQEAASPDRIAAALAPLFEGPERSRQIEALAQASRRLGESGAARRTSAILEEMLGTAGT